MIIPAGHKILVEADPIETVTESGIVLKVDEKLAKADINKGTLRAVGETAWKAFGPDFKGRPWAKVGDRVIFARYAGKILDDPEDGKEYRIMLDDDLVAVITGEK